MGLPVLTFGAALVVGLASASAANAAGLPQLDASKFAPQIAWLIITFVALYVVMARIALPRIGEILDERQRRIAEALEKAESMKEEAARVATTYDKALADARGEAQALFRATTERIAAESARRHAELGARLQGEIKAAEARIAEAKGRALVGLRDAAQDVARAVVERLAGERADERRLVEALDRIIKEGR